MAFLVPISRSLQPENLFIFRIPGEKSDRSLPKMQFITASLRQRFTEAFLEVSQLQQSGKEIDDATAIALLNVQHDVLEHYQPGISDLLDGEQVQALVSEWVTESSVSLGESSPSQVSSARSRRRSSTT